MSEQDGKAVTRIQMDVPSELSAKKLLEKRGSIAKPPDYRPMTPDETIEYLELSTTIAIATGQMSAIDSELKRLQSERQQIDAERLDALTKFMLFTKKCGIEKMTGSEFVKINGRWNVIVPPAPAVKDPAPPSGSGVPS